MRALILAAALLAAATPVAPAPTAQSQQECVSYADLALVAAAMAKQSVSREQVAAALPDMYKLGTDESREIARLILDAAYRAAAGGAAPGDFAHVLLGACLRGRGNMDAILGVKL